MTVKMDRYKIIGDRYYSRSGTARGIQDFLKNEVIMSFDTHNEELNQKFAEMMLEELNTGKYEKELQE